MEKILIKVLLLLFIATISGCGSTPVPKDTVAAQANYLFQKKMQTGSMNGFDPSGNSWDIGGVYIDKPSYYTTSTIYGLRFDGIRYGSDILKSELLSAYANRCKSMQGNFADGFCKIEDNPSGVLFYVDISKVGFYSGKSPRTNIPQNRALSGSETFEVVTIVSKSGDKTDFIKLVEEEIGFVSDQRKKLEKYREEYKTADIFAKSNNIKTASNLYVDFVKKYNSYDPDGVLKRIENYISENKKFLDEENNKILAEEKARQDRQRSETARRQKEYEAQRIAKAAAVKKIGATVCRENGGAQENFSIYGSNKRNPGFNINTKFTTKGVVENLNGDKVQIRVISIRACLRNDCEYINSIKGDSQFTVHQISWVPTDELAICE